MRTVLIAATAGAIAMTGAGTAQAADDVTVMTRNVFLGADLGPALRAGSGSEFLTAVGEIVRQVEATNFPRRAKGLAAEIQQRKPDLIGLQEAALWRKGKVDLNAVYNQEPTATKVVQDFVKILLKEVNKGKVKYEIVKIQNEFDFEAPADLDNNLKTGKSGAEANYRLTMRDAILKRKGVGIKTKDLRGKQYTVKNSFTREGRQLRHRHVAPRLAVDPRQGGRRAMVHLREHASGGVRRPNAGTQHPRPAGRGVREGDGEGEGSAHRPGRLQLRLPGAGAR